MRAPAHVGLDAVFGSCLVAFDDALPMISAALLARRVLNEGGGQRFMRLGFNLQLATSHFMKRVVARPMLAI